MQAHLAVRSGQARGNGIWYGLNNTGPNHGLLGHLEDLRVVWVYGKDMESRVLQGVGLPDDDRDVVVDPLQRTPGQRYRG